MQKISVIIPIYNVEQYLAQCLESVVNQTYKDLEIICVDDASTDNSLEILNKMAAQDSRIKVISYSENRGQGYARNLALKEATGDYIGFIDSDDTIDENYYEYLIKKAIDNNADIVSAQIKHISASGVIEKVCWPKDVISNNEISTVLDEKLVRLYSNGNVSAGKHLMSKKLFQNKILFSENDVYFEDQLFMLKSFYFANKVIDGDENGPVYYYYTRLGSTTNKEFNDAKYKKSKFDQFIVCEEMLKFLKEKDVEQEILNNLVKDFYDVFESTFDSLKNNLYLEYLDKSLETLKDDKKLCNKIKARKYLFLFNKNYIIKIKMKRNYFSFSFLGISIFKKYSTKNKHKVKFLYIPIYSKEV